MESEFFSIVIIEPVSIQSTSNQTQAASALKAVQHFLLKKCSNVNYKFVKFAVVLFFIIFAVVFLCKSVFNANNQSNNPFVTTTTLSTIARIVSTITTTAAATTTTTTIPTISTSRNLNPIPAKL